MQERCDSRCLAFFFDIRAGFERTLNTTIVLKLLGKRDEENLLDYESNHPNHQNFLIQIIACHYLACSTDPAWYMQFIIRSTIHCMARSCVIKYRCNAWCYHNPSDSICHVFSSFTQERERVRNLGLSGWPPGCFCAHGTRSTSSKHCCLFGSFDWWAFRLTYFILCTNHECWKKRYQLSSKSSWPWVVPWRPWVNTPLKIPPPAALVEGVSLRWFILSCEYCISISKIHTQTCYYTLPVAFGKRISKLKNLLGISWNPSPISRFPSPKIRFS